jgi:hypothetical protein
MAMRKKIFIFVIAMFTVICAAETKIEIDGVGFLYIPDTLEIQSGTYKEVADMYKEKIFKIPAEINKIKIQQAGLNTDDKKAKETYCRMNISTQVGNYGDFEILGTKIEADNDEIEILSNILKNQIQEGFKKTKTKTYNQKLVKWNGLSIEQINSYYAVYTSYIRKLNDNPDVVVESYMIHNNDRQHIVTISYRVNETDRWKKVFNKVLKSLVLIKR